MKKHFPLRLIPLLAHAPLFACGGFVEYAGMLNDTGAGLLTAPESILANEMRRLAPGTEFTRPTVEGVDRHGYRITVGVPEAEAFTGLLEAALRQSGRSDDKVGELTAAYLAYRKAATARKSPENKTPAPIATIPAGLPVSFALYEEGARLWRDRKYSEAGAPWNRLLALPENERRPLEAPARLMLAKLALEEKRPDDAKRHIEALRAAVRAGAPDPVGYAAATYQLERHLAQNDWEKLENLLVQSAAGMDRDFVLAHLRLHCFAILARAQTTDRAEFIREAIAHPVARRMVVAYELSRGGPFDEAPRPNTSGKQNAWLSLLSEIPGELPEAAQIASVAYQSGEYTLAKRWYARAPKGNALAALVGSRLMLREGNPDAAASRLAAAVPEYLCLFSPTPGAAGIFREYLNSGTGKEIPLDDFRRKAAAELGMLRMSQGRHAEALDIFLRAELVRDAAVVAERFLTTQQLRDHITNLHPVRFEENAVAEVPPPYGECLNTLLARRLMREGHPDEAEEHFSGEDRKTFDAYRALLRKGYDANSPAAERATAFFAAAKLVAREGECLFLTISGPRRHGEKFHDPDMTEALNDGRIDTLRARIGAGTIRPLPEVRDRYMRFRAGELALYASSLLPENNADSAYMLWTAGRWHADSHDDRSADVFYKLLCIRHQETSLGKTAIKAHWLPRTPPSDAPYDGNGGP